MEKTLIDYFHIIRKKLWLIVLFVALSCVITFYVSKTFVKPVYNASTQLLVSSTFKSQQQIDFNDVNMNLNLIESYKTILKSNTILSEVAANHPEFALTPEQLARKLKVASADKTQIITIEVEDRNYGQAASIANAVAQTFSQTIPSLMNMDNVRILTAADPAKQPAAANSGIAMNLAMSFLLSLMAALGAVFFRENIDDTIRSDKEAEHYVGLPVLSAIGTIRGSEAPKRAKLAKREVGEQKYVAVK